MARVTPPMALTLDATDVPASSYDEWLPATSYIAGEYVVVTTSTPHHEYRALQASTDKEPALNPAYWVDQGATNQYLLLDDTVSTRTTATTSFYSTVIPSGTPTHLAVFGMQNVLSIRVQITFDGVEVYDATTTMQVQRETASYWQFFFGARTYHNSAEIQIGAWYQGEVKVTFAGDTGATIGVGHLTLGTPLDLGATTYGAEIGMTQYSTKEEDDWGNTILVPRPNAKLASVKLLCSDATVDYIYRTLEALDATPAVWNLNNNYEDGAGYDVFRIWGIADFNILLQSVNGTYCELDVKGLI